MAYQILNDNSLELQQELNVLALADSDLTKTEQLRAVYADNIAKEPFYDTARANEIVSTDSYKPLLRDYNINGESLPKRTDLIQMAMDTAMDISSLDHSIINASNQYTKLIAGTIQRLNSIKERLHRNEQRIKDIDFVRNAYAGLGNVIPINDSNMLGDYTLSNNTFSCYVNSITQILFDVDKVAGNGYVGNGYVLDDNGEALQATKDCSDIGNLSDDSLLTTFEYSRLCSDSGRYYYNASQRPEDTNTHMADIMYDDKDVVCTITMHAKTASGFNMVVLDANTNDISIEDVQISNDGKTYARVTNREKGADDNTYTSLKYIPGLNTVYFPTTQYVKITLSSGHSDPEEKLGQSYTDIVDGKPFTTIRPLANVRRKVISLSGIRAYNNRYKDSVMATNDLCPKNGCQSVAIFANQYIPEHIDTKKKEYVKYELIINGIAHQVEPVNSDKNGYKIISCSKDHYGDASVLFIEEPIRTVHVQVMMKELPDNMSPIVGNLKLCIG